MIVSCNQCEMKFKVDDAKIGPRGVKVRCIRCQTMIIVKPPGSDLRDTQPNPPPSVGEQEAPTRVLQLDANARAALAAAAKGGAEEGPTKVTAINSGSFGLDPAPPPPGQNPTLPPLPAFDESDPFPSSEPTLVAPPPMPKPPPLSKPPLPNVQAPPPQVTAMPPPSDDLFSNPFGTAEDLSRHGMVDLDNQGPSLELEQPTKTMEPPRGPDPLADLPKFDESHEGPQFEGGISVEGNVTKPVNMNDLKRTAPGQQDASLPLMPPELEAPVVHEQKTVQRKVEREKPKPKRSVFLRLGQGFVGATILCGYAGLYLLWRAGGIDAFSAKAVQPGALALNNVMVAPFISADGSAFWVVRGEAHNNGGTPLPGAKVQVTLQGHSPVSVPVGAEPDAAKLYAKNEIALLSAPPELGPDQRLPFTAVVPASKIVTSLPEVVVAPAAP